MATTVQVEVMYNDTDADTGTLRRKRVSLEAVHTLDRDNIWYIILSDNISAITSSANANRTIDGVIVDRCAQVWWNDSDSGIAFLIRRGGEVCLQVWEDSSWSWHAESDPFGEVLSSGIDSSFPKDALVFHLVKSPVSSVHSAYAKTLFNQEMF